MRMLRSAARAALERGDEAERYPERELDDRRGEGEQRSLGQAIDDRLAHRLVGREGVAQVALEDAAEVAKVLDVERSRRARSPRAPARSPRRWPAARRTSGPGRWGRGTSPPNVSVTIAQSTTIVHASRLSDVAGHVLADASDQEAPALERRVERVAEAVAEQREADHGEHDRARPGRRRATAPRPDRSDPRRSCFPRTRRAAGCRCRRRRAPPRAGSPSPRRASP